jgi:hypothetical protein
LGGDAARADGIFARYLKLQEGGGDVALPLVHANWLAISGKLQEAITLLKQTHFPSPDLQSLALSQTAIWELMRNEAAEARADAAASLLPASSPSVKALASAANAVITGGQSTESLRQQLGATGMDSDQKALVFAYGLFLTGHFSEAADSWNTLLRNSGGTDLRSRAMLAASLSRAGRAAEPNALPVEPFLPNVTSSDQYTPIAFGEMRRLLSR